MSGRMALVDTAVHGDVQVKTHKSFASSQGRDLMKTFGDIGLAGHWLKLTLHYAFIYKAKMKPFWWLIPE
jgi:sulfide:quinone oxidoreductase